VKLFHSPVTKLSSPSGEKSTDGLVQPVDIQTGNGTRWDWRSLQEEYLAEFDRARCLPSSPLNMNPVEMESPMRRTSSTQGQSRLVTVDDANKMMPLLERVVCDIIEVWDGIIQKRTELECLEKNPIRSDDETCAVAAQDLKLELNLLIDRINGYIREVEELGCFVQEFKRGVINFPTLYVGRKVFLCWRPGDDEVCHWHELDESFTERTPIRDFRDFFFQRSDQ